MRIVNLTVLVFLLVMLAGCGKSNESHSPGLSLYNDQFNALSPENQYLVANNLMGTLFKGVAAKDFFDFTAGTETLSAPGGVNFISKTQTALGTPLDNREYYLDIVDLKYDFDASIYPQQYPLAHLHVLPLSKDFFDYWMAYKLANTILFSPAVELDSVSINDVQNVLYRLYRMIRDNAPIREIVYEHTISQENWRRFRSPEDNTREMMEIYLARFRDDEVPLAAIACRNWHLTDDYQLIKDFNENYVPQDILDTRVTSCYDFYRALSQHRDLIPNIVKTLVDHFFAGLSDTEKQALTGAFTGINPVTFRDLFTNIIFSRTYLLNNNRPRWYEETFFNISNRTEWIANPGFFQYLVRPYGDGGLTRQMKQAVLSYKLGRRELPLDSLSFAYYHKSVREDILINQSANSDDRGWPATFIDDVDLFGEDLIDYLFLSVLSRKPEPGELSTLREVIQARFPTEDDFNRISRQVIAMIVLDYCSRLSELYYMRPVQ